MAVDLLLESHSADVVVAVAVAEFLVAVAGADPVAGVDLADNTIRDLVFATSLLLKEMIP